MNLDCQTVTLKDIARVLGVSVRTVWRVRKSLGLDKCQISITKVHRFSVPLLRRNEAWWRNIEGRDQQRKGTQHTV